MGDPFAAYKNADFSAPAASKRAPPPAPPSRPLSATAPSAQPNSAHYAPPPSSPSNRVRSHSHPAPPPTKPSKPYKRIEHPSRIVLSGTLFKQSHSAFMFHTYHPRFLVLSPTELWWYETEATFEERREPRRIVKLDKASYVMEEGHSGNKLSLVSGGKTYVFKGAHEAEGAAWKEAIEHCLNHVRSASAYNIPPSKKQPLTLRVA